MELRKGFKLTEVGLIPEDWNIVSLETIAFITKLAGFEYSLHFNSYKDGGEIIVLRGTNITHNKIDLSEIKSIPITTSNKLLRSKLFKDDLVFAYVGTIGPIYLVEEDNKFHLGPNTSKITVDKKNDAKFIFHYFQSRYLKNEIIEKTSVGAQPSLSMSKIRSFRIILPPTLAEQTAIATALSDMDNLIAGLEQLIAKKKAIKQGAMQELLRPKEGWVVKKLGELVDVLDNLRVPLNDTQRSTMAGEIPYCGANGIVDYVNDYIIDDDIILMAEDGGYFDEYQTRPIAYRMTGKCWVNNHAHILKAKTDIDQGFVYYSIVHKNLLDYINGGTRAKLNKSDLINIEIPITKNKYEQLDISTVLNDMDEEIMLIEENLEKHKLLKQGMMQELLTGKTRLV